MLEFLLAPVMVLKMDVLLVGARSVYGSTCVVRVGGVWSEVSRVRVWQIQLV